MSTTDHQLSVHDNDVLGYVVDNEAKRIILHTVYRGREPYERTDVVFEDVFAYHFEGDSLGTIVFDVDEASISLAYDEYAYVFERCQNHGWHVAHYKSKEELSEGLKARGYQAFLLSSSYGMYGFVFAKSMQFLAV